MKNINPINKKLVLYVDDQPANLKLFELMFSDYFNIITSIDPIEALDLVKFNSPEVVISDYTMPGMNGIEFLEILKRDFPGIPRIMLTANDDCELEMEANLRCDLFEYLTKPMNMNLIVKTINKAILTTNIYN